MKKKTRNTNSNFLICYECVMVIYTYLGNSINVTLVTFDDSESLNDHFVYKLSYQCFAFSCRTFVFFKLQKFE